MKHVVHLHSSGHMNLCTYGLPIITMLLNECVGFIKNNPLFKSDKHGIFDMKIVRLNEWEMKDWLDTMFGLRFHGNLYEKFARFCVTEWKTSLFWCTQIWRKAFRSAHNQILYKNLVTIGFRPLIAKQSNSIIARRSLKLSIGLKFFEYETMNDMSIDSKTFQRNWWDYEKKTHKVRKSKET